MGLSLLSSFCVVYPYPFYSPAFFLRRRVLILESGDARLQSLTRDTLRVFCCFVTLLDYYVCESTGD